MKPISHRLNKLLFLGNILLFAVLVLMGLIPMVTAIVKGFQFEKFSEMKMYVVRRPFAVFVDGNFPEKRDYRFLDLQNPFSLDMTVRSPIEQEAWMRVGSEFSLACTFLSDPPRADVQEYSMTRGHLTQMDLNADGLYDVRIILKPKLRSDIWVDGRWEEVLIEGAKGKYRRLLLDGTRYCFDAEKGCWIQETGL